MLLLSSGLVSLLQNFAPLFDTRVWSYAQLLLVGAILAPGKRTLTSVLRIMGLSSEKSFQDYHRALNRAHWQLRLKIVRKPKGQEGFAVHPGGGESNARLPGSAGADGSGAITSECRKRQSP